MQLWNLMWIKVSSDEYCGPIHLKYIMYNLKTENWRSVGDLPGFQDFALKFIDALQPTELYQ